MEMLENSAAKVWVVDDDASMRWVLEKALQHDGMQVRSFAEAKSAQLALQIEQPDVLVTDIRMPGISGIKLLQYLESLCPALPVIVITAHADLDSAVTAYRSGAFEYLPKPFDVDKAVMLVRRAARVRGSQPEAAAAMEQGTSAILGKAPAMQQVFRSIGRLSQSSMTVLITGESGTGKELVARALHRHSPRVDAPFVALNTTAIAADLLESELFGHERGAFTGAERQRTGCFEQADGGTLFLDEIGDMSVALQTRLLRVLAEGEFYRVGGQEPIRVDVRIIAATNQDLNKAVERGRFREDLFHRLNVIRITSPPLRERRQDIPLLMHHYLSKAAEELGVQPKSMRDDALGVLQGFDWPGNVRQLINTARRLTVIAPDSEIRVDDVPVELRGQSSSEGVDREWITALARWAEQQLDTYPDRPLLAIALPEFETALIRVALLRARGRRQEAARLLGWGRNTLARKIKELRIDV